MHPQRSPDPAFLGLEWSLRPQGDVTSARDREAFERLNAATHSCKFRKGEIVTAAAEEWPFVAQLRQGTALLSRATKDGRAQIVGLLFPPDIVGRPGARLSDCDVAAASDLELLCISQREFASLVEEVPQLLLPLLESIADELQVAQNWLLLLGRKTAREKVASYLLHVARRAANAEPDETELVIDPILSRESMAGLLGVTTETVSRQFSELAAEGLIRRLGKGHIEIPDMWSLHVESGDPDQEPFNGRAEGRRRQQERETPQSSPASRSTTK